MGKCKRQTNKIKAEKKKVDEKKYLALKVKEEFWQTWPCLACEEVPSQDCNRLMINDKSQMDFDPQSVPFPERNYRRVTCPNTNSGETTTLNVM